MTIANRPPSVIMASIVPAGGYVTTETSGDIIQREQPSDSVNVNVAEYGFLSRQGHIGANDLGAGNGTAATVLKNDTVRIINTDGSTAMLRAGSTINLSAADYTQLSGVGFVA